MPEVSMSTVSCTSETTVDDSNRRTSVKMASSTARHDHNYDVNSPLTMRNQISILRNRLHNTATELQYSKRRE